MTRTLSWFTLAIALATGCDPGEACETLPTVPRVRTLNGAHWNGIDFQATTLNGVHANGIQIQALSMNAILWNGIQVQGAWVNGTGSDTVTVVGEQAGRLVAHAPDGTVIRGLDWAGAEIPFLLSDGTTHTVVVASVEEPAGAEGPLAFALTFEGHNICGEGGRGLFVPGTFDETGRHHPAVPGAEDYTVSFSCDTGVIAKCVHWGYAPWDVGQDLHTTCTRMARADYCGDGVSYTKNGTRIDLYDVHGIVGPQPDPGMSFEAGWGPDGATCVSHPRYRETVVGHGEILPPCWADKPRCDDAEEAATRGATMFNASEPTERLLCDPR